MAFDLGDADGRLVDFDLNQPVPYDGESVATADHLSSSCSSVNWNTEGRHSNSFTFTLPRPSRSAPLPPPPTLPLSPQPSGYAASSTPSPAPSPSPQPSGYAASSTPSPAPSPPPPPQPSPSAALPPPPQPSSYAAPSLPPPPPQTPPLSLGLEMALALAPTPPPPPPQTTPPLSLELALAPPPQSSSNAAPPPPPPSPPRRQREAHGQRGRRPDILDLDSPATQRRRVSDPNQPSPPSQRRPPHSSPGHQEPQHEVPKGSNNLEGHTPPSQFTRLQPSGSGAPPSSPPPVPTSAVPSSSTLKLNTVAGTNSSNGFQLVKAFLKDTRASTVFSIQFICNCGAESKHSMKAITNRELKDQREVKCRCRKKYIIELMSDKFFLSCYAGKKKKKEIGYVTGSLASVDDQIGDD